MSQTLIVSTTTDFSGTVLSPQVTTIDFTNLVGTTARATFGAAQVPAQVANTVVVDGSAGINQLLFRMTVADTFLPQFSFSNWSAADSITIAGSSGNDTIRGVTVAETVNGGAGDDVIFGSSGRDTLIGANGDDAFTYDVSGQETGDRADGRSGKDTLYVASAGNYNFATTTIANIETLLISPIAGGLAQVDLLGTQVGGLGRINTIQLLEGTTILLSIRGSLIDLSELKIKEWSDNDHSLTLQGGNGGANINGSNVAENIYGGSGADDLSGNGGRDALRSSAGLDVQFGGLGGDTFVVNDLAHVQSGEIYDGNEGRDTLDLLVQPTGGYDFTGVTVRSIEVLVLNGGQTVVMDAGAFGTGFGIDTIFGNEGEVDTLQISGSSIDIGDIQFRFWDSSDFLLLGGTDGDDFIAATEVRDTMAGQAGTDEFAFNGETVGKNLWRDSIIDFVAGEDIINLSAIDAMARLRAMGSSVSSARSRTRPVSYGSHKMRSTTRPCFQATSTATAKRISRSR